MEANRLNSGEFDRSSGMRHSLQKAPFVTSRGPNRARLRGFDELYRGSRPAKCKESLARPPSGGSCHDCWVYPIAGRCRDDASEVACESSTAPSQRYGRVFRSCIRRFHLEEQLSRPMANVTPHDLGISLGTSQVRAKVRDHFWIVVRPPLSHRVALDVLI